MSKNPETPQLTRKRARISAFSGAGSGDLAAHGGAPLWPHRQYRRRGLAHRRTISHLLAGVGKGSIVDLTITLAGEVVRHGITVNCISLGAIETEADGARN